eukprot:GHVL01025185.1.p1 GENE.GHVL01025185.1~~GHVL01025185.1.p1  ORF type:complete len:530 (+),score=74.82 GHVL01025185.1:40-1629(+)
MLRGVKRGITKFGNNCAMSTVVLSKDCNQALGIGKYAIDFLESNDKIDPSVTEKCRLFHTDSVLCAISALALKTNAPLILKNEAFEYESKNGAKVFGSNTKVATEKAIVANCSAVREWDSNGTVFGYNPERKQIAGEFGHNDFYPVVIAAAQSTKIDGKSALRAMVCIDEIRGRLAEAFSLKSYKIDHVVYGAIASAAVYGAILGASAEQIESAIGMTVSHYIPFRAIRAGKQLSDSKGSSAALSTEVAILSMKRAMKGFVGPKDVFRNPEAIFRYFEKTNGDCPFDLYLSKSGADFAVSHMHFKLGLYEHQSAGALEGLINILMENQDILSNPDNISKIIITAYEPAFGIIGDPAKKDPQTRQSADHSMVYILSTILRKAFEKKTLSKNVNQTWCDLMLLPADYGHEALHNPITRQLMTKMEFKHGGDEFDRRYPQGIPTQIDIELKNSTKLTSGLVMFPTGHSKNESSNLKQILDHKFKVLSEIALSPEEAEKFRNKLENLPNATCDDLQDIYFFQNLLNHSPIDKN